jgi:hypothetical protein
MYNRLIQGVQCNNILVPEQCDSRKVISTDEKAYNLAEFFYFYYPKMHVREIFCLIVKTADCVNHYILLSKLHF